MKKSLIKNRFIDPHNQNDPSYMLKSKHQIINQAISRFYGQYAIHAMMCDFELLIMVGS